MVKRLIVLGTATMLTGALVSTLVVRPRVVRIYQGNGAICSAKDAWGQFVVPQNSGMTLPTSPARIYLCLQRQGQAVVIPY